MEEITLAFSLLYTTRVYNVKKFNLPNYKIFGNKIEKFSQIDEKYCMYGKKTYNGNQKRYLAEDRRVKYQISTYIIHPQNFSFTHVIASRFMQRSSCGRRQFPRIKFSQEAGYLFSLDLSGVF